MVKNQKALLIGDPMIPGSTFERALAQYLSEYVSEYKVKDWESDWNSLQKRRLIIEQKGPELEVVPDLVLEEGKNASILMGLFLPVSSKLFDAAPNLRIVGVARAGVENVNVKEATKRGILVFNVMGRNAEAVSDFAVGLILAESRNIARAHYAIKNKTWRKEFSNVEFVPQLKGKKIGIAGFGYIGKLVAQKLSGWNLETLVYDPYVSDEAVKSAGCTPVDKDTLFSESDFITLHLRLAESTKNFVDERELSLMKKTAYLINTARAGLVNEKALLTALKEKKISGAGLDVFPSEPVNYEGGYLELDNVTLTTHIAGTTTEVLTGSPGLLMEDMQKFLQGKEAKFIVNPEVQEMEVFKKWIGGEK